jgi:hypothetical protein
MTLSDNRQDKASPPVGVTGGGVRRSPPPPASISDRHRPAPVGDAAGVRASSHPRPRAGAGIYSDPGAKSSLLVTGYGGQARSSQITCPPGLSDEGELAPAWRALKRRVAQAVRRERAERFDPYKLVRTRAIGAALAMCFAGHFIVGMTFIGDGRFPKVSVCFAWSTLVFGIFFALMMPSLGWQEWLAERDREAREAAAGASQ